MNPLFILAIIQGLTEFLPVSSSGHLVLAKLWLGVREEGLEIVTWVHLGTLLALLAYFWKDIARLASSPFRADGEPERRWILFIGVSTLITVAVGLLGRDYFVKAFSNLGMTLAGFIFTGTVLIAARWTHGTRADLRLSDAVWFGAAQAVSILPSVSRSGATIVCLLFLGLNRDTAFRYSFIASIPAIGGAFILEAVKGDFTSLTPYELASSFALAAMFGLASLFVLRRLIIQNQLHWFGAYCLSLGVGGVLWGYR